jgi:hypothetical protein
MRRELQLSHCKVFKDEFKEDYFNIYNHLLPYPVGESGLNWMLLLAEMDGCFLCIEIGDDFKPETVVDGFVGPNFPFSIVVKCEKKQCEVFIRVEKPDFESFVDVPFSVKDFEALYKFIKGWLFYWCDLREAGEHLKKINL